MGIGHQTVLLNEAVEHLNIQDSGLYVDATFGRGGHSQKILNNLKNGQLLIIDRDPQALDVAEKLALKNSNVSIGKGSFDKLGDMIDTSFASKVDGILFDLGVSSPQLDQAERGFSFMQNGPLDMRMDTSEGETAAEWLNTADWKEISKVLWRYGEEKNATKIAKEIVIYREETALFETTEQLATLVETINKRANKKQHKHPATRVFQAIRIHINKELEQIEKVLPIALDNLKPKGRLVVISFHSLEDRIVKRFIKNLLKPKAFDKRMPIAIEPKQTIKTIGKAIKASEHEIQQNSRSRSAIMRVIEKL